MARKTSSKLPSPAEASQDVLDDELVDDDDDESTPAGGTSVSKAKAVRDALSRGHVMPEDGTNYIKRTYGIDISKQMFSSYKSQEKIRQATKGSKDKPGRKSQAGAGRVDEGGSASSPKPSKGNAGILEAMEAMKPLVSNLGAEQVKRIVDLLG